MQCVQRYKFIHNIYFTVIMGLLILGMGIHMYNLLHSPTVQCCNEGVFANITFTNITPRWPRRILISPNINSSRVTAIYRVWTAKWLKRNWLKKWLSGRLSGQVIVSTLSLVIGLKLVGEGWVARVLEWHHWVTPCQLIPRVYRANRVWPHCVTPNRRWPDWSWDT